VDETREEFVQLREAFPDQRFEVERELIWNFASLVAQLRD
jgi:hypothetical protein